LFVKRCHLVNRNIGPDRKAQKDAVNEFVIPGNESARGAGLGASPRVRAGE